MPTTRTHYVECIEADSLAAYLRAQDAPASAMVLALVAEQDRAAIALLQQGARQAGCTLVGAVVPGLIVDSRIVRHGALLSLLPVGTTALLSLPSAQEGQAEAAVLALADFVMDHQPEDASTSLLLFIDAMVPNVASLMDRLYLESGDAVHYVGTCVGSETFQPMPCLFDNERLLGDAVLALLLPQHPGAMLIHAYQRSDSTLRMATSTAGNLIRRIDGRPALDVYQELVQQAYDVTLTPENFYQYGVHFPFALHRAQGEPLVRIPVALGEDGAVYCVGEVPQNAMLGVVQAGTAQDQKNTVQALARWMAGSGQSGAAAMVFYCAGRLLHFGEAAATSEIADLASHLAPRPLFGALSLGEIGSGEAKQSYPAFHNATVVTVPWSG